jgi:hypothetical protein
MDVWRGVLGAEDGLVEIADVEVMVHGVEQHLERGFAGGSNGFLKFQGPFVLRPDLATRARRLLIALCEWNAKSLLFFHLSHALFPGTELHHYTQLATVRHWPGLQIAAFQLPCAALTADGAPGHDDQRPSCFKSLTASSPRRSGEQPRAKPTFKALKNEPHPSPRRLYQRHRSI